MSCSEYFILSKLEQNEVYRNTEDQLITISPKNNVYILPKINLDYYAKYGLFENQLIEWCKQFCSKDKLFLDIGAHTGTYAIALASHSHSVYAYEPQRMTYYGLCGGVALSGKKNIYCMNYGLGSPDQSGANTLRIVSADGGGSSVQDTGLAVLEEEQIEIKTLDSLNLNNIGFIKMDVEDNEVNVLEGGVETIKRNGYPKIIFEWNGGARWVFEKMEEIGYKIIKIGGSENMYLGEK